MMDYKARINEEGRLKDEVIYVPEWKITALFC